MYYLKSVYNKVGNLIYGENNIPEDEIQTKKQEKQQTRDSWSYVKQFGKGIIVVVTVVTAAYLASKRMGSKFKKRRRRQTIER